MISGSTKGVHLDFESNIDRKSVVDLLEDKKISWKAYQESYPEGKYNNNKKHYITLHLLSHHTYIYAYI